MAHRDGNSLGQSRQGPDSGVRLEHDVLELRREENDVLEVRTVILNVLLLSCGETSTNVQCSDRQALIFTYRFTVMRCLGPEFRCCTSHPQSPPGTGHPLPAPGGKKNTL